MSFKFNLIFSMVFMQIRCNFPDISYLSETQKNTFQFLTFAIIILNTSIKIISSASKFTRSIVSAKCYFHARVPEGGL